MLLSRVLLELLPPQLEQLDVLKRCAGWELESAAEDPISGEVALRLGGLFRLRLSVSRTGATATVEVLPGGPLRGAWCVWKRMALLSAAGRSCSHRSSPNHCG